MSDNAYYNSHPDKFVSFFEKTKYGAIFFILLIQNIWIFRAHYFSGYGVPWDFVGTYLAVPYYWIEAVNNGESVSWIPFQGMGYPLYMNLQSGFYYLPNWVFVLFSKSYTVSAAILFQNFHIFMGSVGAFFAARLFILNWKEALLVGLLYQSFGAFYTNAEHVDIIRSLAILPWVMTPILCPWGNKSKLLTCSILFLPMWVLFLWTGGYLGSSIAISFVLGVVFLLRFFIESDNRRVSLLILVSSISGVLLASIQYFPVLFKMSELKQTSGTISYDYFQWIDVFSLIYNVDNPVLPHDISMRSTFVGVVAICLLVAGLNRFLLWNKWLVFTLILSIFMGSKVLHPVIIQYIPQIGLSRFTMSDYRGLIGLALILLAVSNFKHIAYGSKLKSHVFLSVIFLFIVMGNLTLEINSMNNLIPVSRLILFTIVVSFSLYYLASKKPNTALFVLMIVVPLDFSRVHLKKYYYKVPGITKHIETTFGSYSETQKSLHSKFITHPAKREARQDLQEQPLLYKGYYTGEYLMNDYGGSAHLIKYEVIRTTPRLHAFAMSEWKAIRLKNAINNRVPEVEFQLKEEGVKSVDYGTSTLKYDVNILMPTQVVENEIYWEGWSMDILFPTGRHLTIKPYEVEGFRAWSLPQGKYTMQASYKTPWENVSIFIFMCGLFLWIALVGYVIAPKVMTNWRSR